MSQKEFERLLFWSSLDRLLVPLACMPHHGSETCDWGYNSHRGCCHVFSVWNVGDVTLLRFSFLRVWKVLLTSTTALPEPTQAFRKINEYDKRALIRPIDGIYYFIYTGTYNCKLLQGAFTFVLMHFLYMVKWDSRDSLTGCRGTERQGADTSCSLQHKRADSRTQRRGNEGNSVKSILRQ